MSMDPNIAPPDEPEAPSESEAETNYARAIAALELASGSPEALAAPSTEFMVALNSDGSAVVSIGDVDVNVSAEQIDAEMPEELAEIEAMEPMDGAA